MPKSVTTRGERKNATRLHSNFKGHMGAEKGMQLGPFFKNTTIGKTVQDMGNIKSQVIKSK